MAAALKQWCPECQRATETHICPWCQQALCSACGLPCRRCNREED